MIERTQHPRHIAQGQEFRPQFRQRAARLAFEVDDRHIVLRPQHLSERPLEQHLDRQAKPDLMLISTQN
ncbi:hypothetical protein [Cereibacter ovatus]|uniref:hypothetical protein n=1 Tax=Cereibacter ovatus TaxID=439529 RepID=UPI0011451B82|nr:hypothetical protein [Cereibacter ovatus]